MAGSQSFGKRENEKKKQAKRLEKQKRKEERQATGTSSFDDMIAYVDENGNFTDVPPEERKKEAVKLEDIVIAVPKKDDSEPEIQRGRVEGIRLYQGSHVRREVFLPCFVCARGHLGRQHRYFRDGAERTGHECDKHHIDKITIRFTHKNRKK